MKLQSIDAIVRALNQAGVPFIVVGGVAVVAHGYGRQTQDIDLVVRLEPAFIRKMFEALAALGYRPRVPINADAFSDSHQRDRWAVEKGMTVLNFFSDLHRESPIDVFVTEPFDFAAEHAAARVEELSPGTSVRILRLDALLAMKMQAGRPQDLADIAELNRLHNRNQSDG